MNVFEFRDRLIADYSFDIRRFIGILDQRVNALGQVRFCLDSLIWSSRSFDDAGTIDDPISIGAFHSECSSIYCIVKSQRERS